MKLTKEQKEKLKEKIEAEGNGFFHDMELAKEELKILSNNVEEEFGIKASVFKKLVKHHYKASVEEEKAKADEIYELYKTIVG